MTKIEWTGETWNPLKGCRRCSPGCEHCYAERMAYRFSGPGMPYEGLVQLGKQGPRWTGKSGEGELEIPLHWRKARRIFVCSMSDLFFEEHTDEQIAAVFGVMAACPQHTFQVLTKRPERAQRWFRWVEKEARTCNAGRGMTEAAFCLVHAQRQSRDPFLARNVDDICAQRWPLAHVHIGVSAEDKPRAELRIPQLLLLPAAVRFVSYEPALSAINFRPWLTTYNAEANCYCLNKIQPRCPKHDARRIDWVIVGGESGIGARPFDIAWARSVVRQCKEYDVPVFVKQLGKWICGDSAGVVVHRCLLPDGSVFVTPIIGERASKVVDGAVAFGLCNPKGGDMSEWPEDLRVREMPR